jgi:hypothetical protein
MATAAEGMGERESEGRPGRDGGHRGVSDGLGDGCGPHPVSFTAFVIFFRSVLF